ncbi:hypothetical protein TNCV_1064971 [Trichonephila clavipes]|nr:hypothetical protein TNCV_1064971 [Trichonephila clavipes]
MSLAVALCTMQVLVILLGSNTIFEGEQTGGAVRGLTISLHISPNSREDDLSGCLEYPMSRRHYTFINIHTFSGIRTRPYSTAISVTNHYTRWAARKLQFPN